MLSPMPFVKSWFPDDNGDIAPGGLLFIYQSGTSTKATSYSDSGGASPNTNPVVLDASGRADVFLPQGTYKFVLAPPTDTDPPTSPIWTEDGIPTVPLQQSTVDISGQVGENVTKSDCLYLSYGAGGLIAGNWYKADSDFAYASVLPGSIGFATASYAAGETAVIRTQGLLDGLGGLTEGVTYYVSATPGQITSTEPVNARAVGVASAADALIVGGVPPVIFPIQPGVVFGGTLTGIFPVVLQSSYDGGAAATPTLTIPAGTIGDGDSLICEWSTDYSSATLSARFAIGGNNVDATTGGNTTVTNARVKVSRISATSLRVVYAGQQSAVPMTSSATVTVSDLAANTCTVAMSMASGTYTIRDYSVTYIPHKAV